MKPPVPTRSSVAWCDSQKSVSLFDAPLYSSEVIQSRDSLWFWRQVHSTIPTQNGSVRGCSE